MRTLRAWTYEMMTRQFLDGLIVGFLCGAMIVTCTALWWAQDRSIVRAAKAATFPTNGGDTAGGVLIESAEEPGRYEFRVPPDATKIVGMKERRATGTVEVGPTTGILIHFMGKTYPIPWPPAELIDLTVETPQWRGDAKPGDVKMLCAFYEEKRMIVNPCPSSWVSPTGLPSSINVATSALHTAPAPSFPAGQRQPHTPRRVPSSALLAP